MRAAPPAHRGGRGARGEGRRRARLHTLRWRIILVFSGLLAVLAVALGLALNEVVGVTLRADELRSFSVQSRVTVRGQQARFDALVAGRAAGGAGVASAPVLAGCDGAVSYQDAFAEAVAQPLSFQRDEQAAYLLNDLGDVLAPSDDPQVANQPAPYLNRLRLDQLWAAVLAGRRTGLNDIPVASYTYAAPGGQRFGVVLIPERFHVASPCVDARNPTVVGVVEVVTNYANAEDTLAHLRLVLMLGVAGLFVAGVLLGGPLIAQALAPLGRMTAIARRIADGDLSQRVRLPHGGDEIGQLADAFDEMAERIEGAFAAQAASEARVRQFVADASHELRTPLTAIRGYTDVLLRGAAGDDPAVAEQILLATRRESERMSRLVNDLLTLARLDAGRPLERQPTDLVALVGEAVDQGRILAGEREVSLATDGRGRLVLPLDPDGIKQVLLILIDNALKYGRPAPEGWVRVRVGRSERGAVVAVADNGRGIAPEDLPHVFDRFYRGDRAARRRRMTGAQVAAWPAEPPAPSAGPAGPPASERGASGSGLGLAIARAIVQAHGGTLTVESRLGMGTTCTLALPLA